MSVKINIDVRQLKSDIKDILDRKIGAVTSDSMIYDQVMGAIWEGMQMSGELPVDSGALEAGEGTHYPTKTQWRDSNGRIHNHIGYPRIGLTHTTFHSRSATLQIDPYEIRPSKEVHYAEYKQDEIFAARDSAIEDPYVLSQIADIVGDKMRKS